jgi:hypothetical protein
MVWPEARFKGEALVRPARANKVAVKTGRLLASMLVIGLGEEDVDMKLERGTILSLIYTCFQPILTCQARAEQDRS